MIIEARHLDLVSHILAAHVPDHEVWAFGSRVHGRNLKPFSDLDLAIPNQSPLPAGTLWQLKEAFSESDLPFKVDLIEQSTTSADFWQHILKQHEILQSHNQQADVP